MARLRADVDLPDLDGTAYQLVRKIGSGGMSTVYLADDLKLGRRVAVKVLSAPDESGELAARMTREARIIAQLEHPGIVPVHDVGTLADGRVYYAMKLVQGRRLDNYEAPLSDRLRVFQRACDAVAFAHASGVIHRDLKPENLMIGAYGEVLVMDWGIAKVLSLPRADSSEIREQEAAPSAHADGLEHGETLSQRLSVGPALDTAHGTVIGTPAYMSPEQALGEVAALDERTDVYSLGAILYYILTGRPPYASATIADIRQRFLTQTPIGPRRLDRKIPRAIESVCLKALSKDARDRYRSAEEMSADVARFLDGLPVSAHRESLLEKSARVLNRNRFLVVLILVYLLMRILVAFFAGR
ncbi:MAG TPA: serine/threonine-protein kinase [Blastocatellia bacterium]|nr:serine/threonine-protein kinase [Blastocatellia bacterium]